MGKSIKLRIVDRKMHDDYVVTNLAMDCHKRKCDSCILKFQCFSTKWYRTRHGMMNAGEFISIDIKDAVRYLEYHDNGVWLVWKNSRAKQRKGELIRAFGNG